MELSISFLAFTVAGIMALIIIILILHRVYKNKKAAKKEKQKTERREDLDFKKNLTEQLLSISGVNAEILKYLKISSQKYLDEITESQVRIVIDSLLSSSQHEIQQYALKCIKDNDIKGNEKEIVSKLKAFINNRFHEDILFFKEFKYKNIYLNDVINNEWRLYIVENVLDAVIKEKGEKALISMLQNSFDSLKFEMMDKLI
jgi:hypothetical protein